MFAFSRAASAFIDKFSGLANDSGKVAGLVDFSQINQPFRVGGFQITPEGKVSGGIGTRYGNINIGMVAKLSRLGNRAKKIDLSDFRIGRNNLKNSSNYILTGLQSQCFPRFPLGGCSLAEVVATLLEVNCHRQTVNTFAHYRKRCNAPGSLWMMGKLGSLHSNTDIR